MIFLDVLGHYVCDEETCNAEIPIAFILGLNGGWAAKVDSNLPPEKQWQVVPDMRSGVWVTRCPIHHAKILSGPLPRIISERPKGTQ